MLAPAFGFLELWKARLSASEMSLWEQTDRLPVYHYGDQAERNLGFQLMKDAEQYPLIPEFHQPALILHGVSDDTVPLSSSVDFARKHSNAKLIEVDSDHELGDVLDQVWQETWRFLSGVPLENR